jgi:hypothetical protein
MARSRDINDRAIADFTQAIRLDPKYAREKGIEQMLATLQKSQAQTPSQKNSCAVIAPTTAVHSGIRRAGGRYG